MCVCLGRGWLLGGWVHASCWADCGVWELFETLICMHLYDVCRVDMILCKSIIFFELDMLTHTYEIVCTAYSLAIQFFHEILFARLGSLNTSAITGLPIFSTYSINLSLHLFRFQRFQYLFQRFPYLFWPLVIPAMLVPTEVSSVLSYWTLNWYFYDLSRWWCQI